MSRHRSRGHEVGAAVYQITLAGISQSGNILENDFYLFIT